MRIKRINEFHKPEHDDDMRDKRIIVKNRLSNIDLKKELKSKLDELYSLIDRL